MPDATNAPQLAPALTDRQKQALLIWLHLHTAESLGNKSKLELANYVRGLGTNGDVSGIVDYVSQNFRISRDARVDWNNGGKDSGGLWQPGADCPGFQQIHDLFFPNNGPATEIA